MKDTIKRIRKEVKEWEDTFTNNIYLNHISNKSLLSKIYIELIKLNSKEQKH